MSPDVAHKVPSATAGWQRRPLDAAEAALAYPLLLAADGRIEPLPVWQARVAAWLQGREARRGITTLRGQGGVIAALFFHAVAGTPAFLGVWRLRVVEPAGRYQGLQQALAAVEDVALEHGCVGVLLGAEGQASGWLRLQADLRRVAPACGYVPRGAGWFRPLKDADGLIRLPSALL